MASQIIGNSTVCVTACSLADVKENTKALYYWPFTKGIHWWSPKRPALWKAFPWHDVIMYCTHGSHRPWKVLEFECCLEKCLIFQSALKMGNFPWKVLENDFYSFEKLKAPETQSLSVFFCTFDLKKVMGFTLSSNLRHYWSSELCFSRRKLPNQYFFVCISLSLCIQLKYKLWIL